MTDQPATDAAPGTPGAGGGRLGSFLDGFLGRVSSTLAAVSTALLVLSGGLVVGGLGLAWDLTPALSLTPIVTAGWGMVQADTAFVGPGARRLDRASDDLLFNWDVQEILSGGALRLDYAAPLPGDVTFTGRTRLNWVFGTTYSASSRVLEGDASFGVATAHGELDGPTTHAVFGRELRWILFAAGTWITGDGSDALGGDWIAEFGLGAGLWTEITRKSVVPTG